MFVLLAAAAGTMCAAEIAETKYIYATDEHEFLTAAVERAMIAADVSRAKRAERVDSAAAAFILQGAIDALTRA